MDWQSMAAVAIASIIFALGYLLGMMRREKREADEEAAYYYQQLADRHEPRHARTAPAQTVSEFSAFADD